MDNSKAALVAPTVGAGADKKEDGNMWLWSMVGIAAAVLVVMFGMSELNMHKIRKHVKIMQSSTCAANEDYDGNDDYREERFADAAPTLPPPVAPTLPPPVAPTEAPRLTDPSMPVVEQKVTVPRNESESESESESNNVNEKVPTIDYANVAGTVPQRKKQAETDKLEAERKKRQLDQELNNPELPASDHFEGESPADFFLYDRQITAYLKPRHLGGVDYVRGDIYIPPDLNRGMFSVPPSSVRDLCEGALSQISDVKSHINRTDLLYDRGTQRDRSNDEDWETYNAPFVYEYKDYEPGQEQHRY
jgi:hypothetical protein